MTAASRLSSPPIPRSGATDIGRPPRAQSACPLDQAPGLLSQRSRNHQIPSSTSFRATDATGTGNRPEVRSGARTPRATHNQPGTPASLLPRDHDGAGSPEQWTSVPVPALVTAEQFELAQARLEENSCFATRNSREPALLKGILVYRPVTDELDLNAPCQRRADPRPSQRSRRPTSRFCRRT